MHVIHSKPYLVERKGINYKLQFSLEPIDIAQHPECVIVDLSHLPKEVADLLVWAQLEE